MISDATRLINRLSSNYIWRLISNRKRDPAISGFLFLSLAQCVFALSGYVVNVGLARILGPYQYGQYGVVISVLTWLEILLSTGLATATTKMIAEMPDASACIRRLTLRLMVAISLLLFLAIQVLSGSISKLLSDEGLTILIKIAAIDMLFYGIMKVYIAVHTGLRKYGRTSTIVLAYAISKTVFILGLAVWGFGIRGALIGNFLASISGICVGMLMTESVVNSSIDKSRFWGSARVTLPTTVWAICIILLMSVDLWVAKALIGGEEIGYYVAAGAIARLIYVMSMGIRGIVLPEVAKHFSIGAYALARRSLMRVMIGFLPLSLGAVLLLHTFSEEIVVAIFSDNYRNAAPLLSIMAWGYFAMTYCDLFARALTAIGKAWIAGKIFLILSLSSIFVHIFLVQRFGIYGAAYGFVFLSVIGGITGGGLLFFTIRHPNT